MRVDTLTSIKVFRQVVESGSFVAAAERLDLSTAMVSKHVMHAEKRLAQTTVSPVSTLVVATSSRHPEAALRATACTSSSLR